MAAMNDMYSPLNTRVLFSLMDLGIGKQYMLSSHITMESEKYICVKETNNVVVIDMAQHIHPIRIPITVDSAIMNPDTPILAFKFQAKIEGTSQDQLQIYDINKNTILKSCNIAEKVEYLKWISRKMLGLVTQKAIYHWCIQGSKGPIKVSDLPKGFGNHSKISNYMLDPSEKWVALTVYGSPKFVFVRPNQGRDQWFRIDGEAAAFTIVNVEGSDGPSTLLCSAYGRKRDYKTHCIELIVSHGFVSQQGEINFRKKQVQFDTGAAESVRAVQISQKYGLIFVITWKALISIHDLETAETMYSCDIDNENTFASPTIRTTGGPSFYVINYIGQVLLTSVNDWTIILSFVNDELPTREKINPLRKLCRRILKEKEETIKKLEKSLQEEISSKLVELKNPQISQEETLNRIEEQLRNETEETDNYQKSQEEIMNKLEAFHLLKETDNLEAIFTEYSRAELEKVTNEFNDLHKIGEGGYGQVYKAFIELKPVAIKIPITVRRNGEKEFDREVEMMKTIRHPNIVRLVGSCKEAQALVYELMQNGSLSAILLNEQRRHVLTSKRRIRIALDICSGLIALHSTQPQGIVHADLKPGNILLDSNYTAKLCDFGQSRHLQTNANRSTPHWSTPNIKGTPLYWDKEQQRMTGEVTAQSDVHAFGIILLQLVTGRNPFELRKEVEAAIEKEENIVDASAGEWPLEEAMKMVQLGLKCSDPERKTRPKTLDKEVLRDIKSMWDASGRF